MCPTVGNEIERRHEATFVLGMRPEVRKRNPRVETRVRIVSRIALQREVDPVSSEFKYIRKCRSIGIGDYIKLCRFEDLRLL